jgi:anti-sigma factor RsiW
MKCAEIRPELVVYHFGETSPDVRATVEEHLLGCHDCLQDFLRLKRDIETADLDSAPSREAHARLRDAVAREVCPEEVRQPWSWWERPFAFAFAGAAVVAAIFVLQMVASSPGSVPRSLEEPPRTAGEPAP